MLLLTAAAPHSADLADYLILDNPQALSILNKYEQPVSSDERRLLVPRVPLRILSEKQLLGDQLSSAMRVDLDGRTLYLQLDDQGKLVNEAAAGVKRILKRCEVLGDTVIVTRSGIVNLSRDPGLGGAQTPVVKGAQLEIVLRTGNTYSVKLLGIRPVYGWCPVSSQDAWRASGSSIAAVADTALSAALSERIVARFESANRSYRQLFDHFNKTTGAEKTPPQWEPQALRGTLACTLTGPHNSAAMLESSTRVLVEDVRSLLLGKPFSVTYANGVLRVEPGSR